MIDLNLIPKDGQWTEERVQSYYLQRIAKSLETIERQNRTAERTYELLQKEREGHSISKTALSLMLYKGEVGGVFGSEKVMRLSDLMSKLRAKQIIGWISREELREAIREIDYLEVEKQGNGFRVKLIGGEQNE